MSRRKKRGAHAGRRMLFGLNMTVVIVLAVCLFGIVNYLSFRAHIRFDLSNSQFYRLSEKTLAVLDSISNRVDVIVFAEPGRAGYDDIVSLLDEYCCEQPRIHVVRIDPNRDIARADQIEKQYKIESENVVIFDLGGRSRVVSEKDLVEVDRSPVKEGKSPVKVAFMGEQVFTSALQSIISDTRPVVYFLQGHGEGDPKNFDPKAGYSKCAAAIKRDNIEIKTITLGETQKIPDDCMALIVAGPAKKFSPQEFDLLRNYLNSNGRMLLLLESMRNVGMRAFLREWQVDLGNDIVIDKTRTLSGRELFVTKYGQHPITRNLHGTSSIMYLPRSVEPLAPSKNETPAADRPHATFLATASSQGWAETDWTHTPMKYDPATEKAGELSVAVAVERGMAGELDMQIHPTRLVVFGDSTFVANGGLAGANMEFLMASLNWLLEREDMIVAAPRAYDESRLLLDRNQIILLGAILVFGLPLAVMLIGVVVWMFRRR